MNPNPAPLRIRPGPSRWLAAWRVGSHGLALLAVLLWAVPLWVQALLATLVLGSLARGVLGQPPGSIRAAVWDAAGIWTLTLASGERIEAQLLPDSLVTLPLIILNFRLGPWRRRSLVLFRDALDPDTARRLRARLRMTPVRAAPDELASA